MKKILVFTVLLGLTSCLSVKKKEITSPPGYDLTHPQTYKMVRKLSEISGIAFHGSNNDSLFAIQDESGSVYQFKIGGDSVQSSRFGKKGDYEDITIYKNTAIVLRSDGKLFSMPVEQLNNPEVSFVKEWKDLIPEAEYESIFADEKNNEVTVLCKQCKGDKKDNRVTGYVLTISGDSIHQKNHFSFDVKQLENYIPSKKYIVFKPSAIAKNPLTNEWYILSSVNKLLVITNLSWKVTQVHELKAELFEQPEGMAFDSNGNLYISSEAGEGEAGSVMKFTYVKSQ